MRRLKSAPQIRSNKPRCNTWLSAFLLVLLSSCAPQASKLKIAAASDLNFALREIAPKFPGAQLDIAYGSSGNFYTQITNGAPYDLLLSADLDYPRKLAAAHIGLADSLFTYGAGRIVVWVPAASALDPATALRSPDVKHLAIANPQHAPYGRAAEAALRTLGLYDSMKPKLVLGENISQTLQFVESGAADAGIVALSLALAPAAKGRYWEIPIDAYPRLEQGGIILKDSAAGREFRAFLTAGDGRQTLMRFGFITRE
ncbi:MAG: molybdate ABC transporter substrate-binding protein [Candidatus Solibacter sp.]